MNSNDRKMAVIGAVVVFVALIGSAMTATQPTGVPGGEKTFTLMWKDQEATASISGSTDENSQTENTIAITEPNVMSVTVTFSYTDDIPAIGGGFNDQFTIKVVSPSGEEKSATADASGKATITFDFPGPQRNTTVKASSRDEASKMVEEMYTSLVGTGNYTLTVEAGNCPGRGVGLFPIDRDTGNDWDVEVTYSYYTVTVVSTTSITGAEVV